jgi:hypothetical protein
MLLLDTLRRYTGFVNWYIVISKLLTSTDMFLDKYKPLVLNVMLIFVKNGN